MTVGKGEPIPDGSHTVTPHLVVRGAGKAIEFYKKAFGAKEIMHCVGPDGHLFAACVGNDASTSAEDSR